MVKFGFFLFTWLSFTQVGAQNIELPTPPTTANHQYQLVVASYGDETLSQEVQESLAIDFLTAMGQLGLSALSVDSLKNLQMNFKSFHDQLAKALVSVNDSLPEEQSIPLNLIYLPIEQNALIQKNETLSAFDLSGNLAFATDALTLGALKLSPGSDMGDTEFEWYTSVSNSLASHNHQMSQTKGSPGLYFSALQMQMNLQKDKSSMQLQIMAGLNEQKHEIGKVNDQVRINDMVVPSFTEIIDQNAGISMAEAPGYFSKTPMIVMSTSFIQEEADKPLELGLALGAFNGLGTSWTGTSVLDEFAIAGTSLPSEIGAEQWLMECQDRMDSVPALKGTLAQGAVGAGQLGKLVEKANVSIAFHFFNLWFQFNDKGEPYIPPGHLDVRVALAGGIGGLAECIVMGDVNQQLSSELNSTIKAQLEELLHVDSLADELLSQF